MLLIGKITGNAKNHASEILFSLKGERICEEAVSFSESSISDASKLFVVLVLE
jgi:hypothetical protein